MPYTQDGLPFQSNSTTSREAALRAVKFVGEQGVTVLDFIRDRGTWGATQKEACDELRIGRPSMCARFRALEQSGEIVKVAETRDYCRVYRAKEA